MKRLLCLAFLIAVACVAVTGQTPCSKGTKFRNCKACGSATSAKGQNLNVLKNRDEAATNPQEVTVAEIRKKANNTGHFDPSQKVSVTGYVASLDKGGFKESCNCGRTDLRDIHINIVAKASEQNDKTKFVVVEITPRWQERLELDDSNYNAMLDILPLYARLISSAEFTLEAPYGGTGRNDVPRGSPNSFSDRVAWLRP